jgi:hypothetical protein
MGRLSQVVIELEPYSWNGCVSSLVTFGLNAGGAAFGNPTSGLRRIFMTARKQRTIREGIWVKVRDPLDGEEETIHIVDDQAADPKQNRISMTSPLGEALFDGKLGETVTCQTPGGPVQFEILATGRATT